MQEDEAPPPHDDKRREGNVAAAPQMQAQIGRTLRALFAEAEAQPLPDRLRELMEALAAQEKKAE